MPDTIALAGATGRLGQEIATSLIEHGANVRAIVRPTSSPEKVANLRKLGARIVTVDYSTGNQLADACRDCTCVVSAMAGLRKVIVNAQTVLLEGAVKAGVPRFIPSDYCIDYTKLEPGSNRNLDLRREFQQRLDKAPIAATSVLNGMFTDLLTDQAPVILFDRKRVLYWGNADQLMDFTTLEDTAAYTAAAALDPVTPRFLKIAGDQISARGLSIVATEITGETFKLLRPGGLGVLSIIIAIMRKVMPARENLYPPWQGMQYMRDMLSGEAKLSPLDNTRYSNIRWTTVKDVLARYLGEKETPQDNSIKSGLILKGEETRYNNGLPLLTPSQNKTELEWLEGSMTTFARNVASFLPGHFEAYVRIYHPFENGDNDGRIMRSWNELAASAGVDLTDPKAAEEFAYSGIANAQARVGRRPKILVESLIEQLKSATSTPAHCFFAVWEGFGDSVAHHFVEPMLSLPARRYHVFEGPIEASRTSFSDVSFVYTAANLWWPADRAWFVSTEVDSAWTYVGGSRLLIDALLNDTRLDSVETSATARW